MHLFAGLSRLGRVPIRRVGFLFNPSNSRAWNLTTEARLSARNSWVDSNPQRREIRKFPGAEAAFDFRHSRMTSEENQARWAHKRPFSPGSLK
eukprot:4060314-Pyramimonas_sp.AAC.1